MATYWYRYFLLTPRNVLRKFRIPVHSPSSVLTWISRAPSPSSSRAHSRSAWHTVDRVRPIPGSPLYPCHSSVLTAAIGHVARLTTRRNVSPSDRSVTVSRRVPLSRPTTPHTGGRSLSHVPWPRTLFARRRGGSSGAGCGTPFFPRVLVRLVGLQHLVIQRHPVAVPEGQVLEPVPQVQQLRAVALQLPGQLCGGDTLCEPADDQHEFGRPPLDPVEGRVGEGVEHPPAVAAPVVQDRGSAAAVDGHTVALMTAWAGEPVGVQ